MQQISARPHSLLLQLCRLALLTPLLLLLTLVARPGREREEMGARRWCLAACLTSALARLPLAAALNLTCGNNKQTYAHPPVCHERLCQPLPQASPPPRKHMGFRRPPVRHEHLGLCQPLLVVVVIRGQVLLQLHRIGVLLAADL